VDKPPQNNEGTPPPSIADDPTIKSLTEKLVDNPDDAGAHYRAGQVYASKGAYSLAIKARRFAAAQSERCGSLQQPLLGPHRDRDLQQALRDCNEALRLRPNFSMPSIAAACQSEEGLPERDCRF